MRGRGPRRLLAALLLPALVALAGCAEQAPADASTDDFCQQWTSLPSAATGRDFRGVATDLRTVGTPGDISDDAREGFGVFVRVASGLEADATLDELVDPSVSDNEARDLKVFIEYASETCSSLDDGADAL